MRPILRRSIPPLNYSLLCSLITLHFFFAAAKGEASTPFEWGDKPLPIFPLEEIKPGLRGVGWSVFRGSEPDSFGVEILGVMKGTGPNSSRILFIAEGEFLQKTGIVSGMSGSPVLIDGRLVGAAAFAYGFAKDPIGAITPIGEMMAILDLPADTLRAKTGMPRKGDVDFRTTRDGGPGDLIAWRSLCEDPKAWAEKLVGPYATAGATATATSLIPIQTPVSISPMTPDARTLMTPLFEALGWIPSESIPSTTLDRLIENATPAAGCGLGDSQAHPLSAAAGAGGSEGRPGPIVPGSSIGARLLGGDADLTAIGTVTYRSGNRILAFGHPMMNSGALFMPLVQAEIHGVMPSRNVSFKMGSGGETVGTLVQDQRAGISGVLGFPPKTLPMEVSIRDPLGVKREYHFDLVRQQFLTPFLVAWAASNSFTYNLAEADAVTADIRIQIHLTDGRTLHFRDLISSQQPAGSLGLSATQMMTYLLQSTFAPFPVESISLDAGIEWGLKRLVLEKVEADQSSIEPGDVVRLRVFMRQHEGKAAWREYDVPIPKQVQGDRIIVIASSFQDFLTWDQERAPEKYSPQDFEHLIDLLGDLPSQEDLIIRVYAPSAGALIRGREVGSLPGSVLRILQDPSTQGTVSPISGLLVYEERIPLGYQLLGGSGVVLQVTRKGVK